MGSVGLESPTLIRNFLSLLGLPYKMPQTAWLNNRNLFSLSYGGWRSQIKVWAVFISPEASLLGLPSPCAFTCLSLRVCSCPLSHPLLRRHQSSRIRAPPL